MKKILSIFLLIVYCTWSAPFTMEVYAVDEIEMETSTTLEVNSNSVELELSAKSVVLMEASTGTIIYEKEAHMELAPASVTKVMTLLLIFEALEEGIITLEEEVVVSEYAASMGGSQVYLEPGEIQSVETMIKCITVSSANDACVAMAEHVAGSETEFVNQMNERAKELSMENTHFVNCNGLDADGHLTTAYDIALMSTELMQNHPQIEEYTMIWMENITHTTNKGTSEFGLSNTNKLVRYYEYTTGLKTGYTSSAGSCISASARKNGIDMIAVVMGAPASTDRNADAVKLLDHGFANCQRYTDDDKIKLESIDLVGGVEAKIEGEILDTFSYVDISGGNLSAMVKEIHYMEDLKAPITKGDVVGSVDYYMEGEKVGEIPITAAYDVEAMDFKNAILQVLEVFVM